jgi:uncharacterized membrane protein YeiB
LAGVGLALASGGWNRHRGGRMMADRVGLAARAVVVGIVALMIAAIIQPSDPETSILLYFAVYFLLAIPFLSLGPRALFVGAAVCVLAGPVLMQQLGPVLPESSTFNHTVVELVTEPAGTAAELLVTGAYPGLCFLAYILAGLGLGRLNLHSLRVQALIVGIGACLAAAAHAASYLLLHRAGGYQALLATEGMTQEALDEALVFGPLVLPNTSAWWLAITAPHSNTPLAIVYSLGISMVVLGVFLLVARRFDRWLAPLTAMGAMTLSIYSAHMVVLSFELHFDDPLLWYCVQLSVAVVFALVWTRWVGRGPLEWAMTSLARPAHRYVMEGAATEVAQASSAVAGTSVPPSSTRSLSGEVQSPSGGDRSAPRPRPPGESS